VWRTGIAEQTSEHGEVEVVECDSDRCEFVDSVRDVQSGSGVTLEWKRVDNKGGGTTLASARALCLDLLSRVWLRISGGLNCC